MKKVGGGPGWGGMGWEGQCGCEIEVIVKMKKVGGGPVKGVGVRADVNKELKLL